MNFTFIAGIKGGSKRITYFAQILLICVGTDTFTKSTKPHL